ncbi:hypothetical protein COCNU_scaffold003417G000070 [Cocos nucifera]|nr:hypothetical protein [Cocos nucifera]
MNKVVRFLTSFLGTVMRKGQLCPLSYAKWNDILYACKLEILRVVERAHGLELAMKEMLMLKCMFDKTREAISSSERLNVFL